MINLKDNLMLRDEKHMHLDTCKFYRLIQSFMYKAGTFHSIIH